MFLAQLRQAPRTSAFLALVACTLLLLWPALVSGFPIMFPDSGTYLGIAWGREYAIDRSSFYGFMLKPIVTLVPGLAGLWIAVALQAAAVAGALRITQERIVPGLAPSEAFLWILPVALLTSLPWHAAQFMPDALTGPLVLLTWAAASEEKGARLLWLFVFFAALAHYTHIVLLVAVAGSTILADLALRRDWRSCARRAGAAALVAVAVFTTQTAANSSVLGRASYSPGGPIFLFARLHEDGLASRWLDRHCGRDAPAELCAERANIHADSQVLLWHDRNGIVARHIWYPGTAEERWRWVEMLNLVNRGAIAEEPGGFLLTAARSTWTQLTHFALLDDECPVNCGSPEDGVNASLLLHSPASYRAFQASAQPRGDLGRERLRALTTPVAALGMVLLPFAIAFAWRRRDAIALSLAASAAVALLANAAMAGALSDVHDRYQSRIVWVVPFLLAGLALRWRRGRTVAPLPGLHPA
jgi:hypothetical protein